MQPQNILKLKIKITNWINKKSTKNVFLMQNTFLKKKKKKEKNTTRLNIVE